MDEFDEKWDSLVVTVHGGLLSEIKVQINCLVGISQQQQQQPENNFDSISNSAVNLTADDKIRSRTSGYTAAVQGGMPTSNSR